MCIAIGSHILKTRALGLSKHATVVQTETKAITAACREITELINTDEEIRREERKVVILTESGTTLLALDKIDTKKEVFSKA